MAGNTLQVEIEGTVVFEKLWDALSSGKYRYIRLVGGTGASKTHSILQGVYLWGSINPNERISCFRATKENCRKTVGEDARQLYVKYPIRMFHKTTLTQYLHSGSYVEFTGTEDSDILHGYATGLVWFNEPYDIPEKVFIELDKRTKSCVIVDLNPKEDHWSDKLSKRKDCFTIYCDYTDNGFISERRRETILSYKPVSHSKIVLDEKMTEVAAKQYDCAKNPKNIAKEYLHDLMLCQVNEAQGSASEYQWKVYGLGEKADRPNRIFKWKPITYDDYSKIEKKKYYCIDWGVSDPFAVIEVKVMDGALYCHELNYKSENEWNRDLAKMGIVLDEESGGVAAYILETIKVDKKAKIICDSARPDRVMGLRKKGWDEAQSIGKKELIVDSVSSMQQIKIYYTSGSTNIHEEQEKYEKETDRYGIVLETPVDKDNHAMDAIRYMVTYFKRQGILKLV